MRLPLFPTGDNARRQQPSTRYSLEHQFQRFFLGRSLGRHGGVRSDRFKMSRMDIQSSMGSMVDSESPSSHGYSRSSIPPRSDSSSRSPSHSNSHPVSPEPQPSFPTQAHIVHSPYVDIADEEQGITERVLHQQRRRRRRRRTNIMLDKCRLLGLKPTTMKAKIISCILSGVFLIVILSTCKCPLHLTFFGQESR